MDSIFAFISAFILLFGKIDITRNNANLQSAIEASQQKLKKKKKKVSLVFNSEIWLKAWKAQIRGLRVSKTSNFGLFKLLNRISDLNTSSRAPSYVIIRMTNNLDADEVGL